MSEERAVPTLVCVFTAAAAHAVARILLASRAQAWVQHVKVDLQVKESNLKKVGMHGEMQASLQVMSNVLQDTSICGGLQFWRCWWVCERVLFLVRFSSTVAGEVIPARGYSGKNLLVQV